MMMQNRAKGEYRMPDTHTTSVDQQRLEKERIEDDGTVTLTRGGHAIH